MSVTRELPRYIHGRTGALVHALQIAGLKMDSRDPNVTTITWREEGYSEVKFERSWEQLGKPHDGMYAICSPSAFGHFKFVSEADFKAEHRKEEDQAKASSVISNFLSMTAQSQVMMQEMGNYVKLLMDLKAARAFQLQCKAEGDSAIETGATRDAAEWMRKASEALADYLIKNQVEFMEG